MTVAPLRAECRAGSGYYRGQPIHFHGRHASGDVPNRRKWISCPLSVSVSRQITVESGARQLTCTRGGRAISPSRLMKAISRSDPVSLFWRCPERQLTLVLGRVPTLSMLLQRIRDHEKRACNRDGESDDLDRRHERFVMQDSCAAGERQENDDEGHPRRQGDCHHQRPRNGFQYKAAHRSAGRATISGMSFSPIHTTTTGLTE